jgi:hypothetical protein
MQVNSDLIYLALNVASVVLLYRIWSVLTEKLK